MALRRSYGGLATKVFGEQGTIRTTTTSCGAGASRRPGRPARDRRAGGRPLPRWRVLDSGWVPRRRGVLRPVRIPDHVAAGCRVAALLDDRAGRVLDPAGQAPVAGAVLPGRGDRDLLPARRRRRRGSRP